MKKIMLMCLLASSLNLKAQHFSFEDFNYSIKSTPRSLKNFLNTLKVNYRWLGVDNNGIELRSFKTLPESYLLSELKGDAALKDVVRRCVVGVEGAYGNHIAKEEQDVLLRLVFSKEGKRKLDDMRHFDHLSFHELKGVPGDIASVSKDGCALVVTSEKGENFVLQGYLMD